LRRKMDSAAGAGVLKGLLFITGPDRSLGFRCAGFDVMEVGPAEDVSRIILDIQAEGRYGLVVMEQYLFEAVSEAAMKRVRKRGLPVVIHMDMPRRWEEAGYAESPVVRLIRKAIGYQIKIKR